MDSISQRVLVVDDEDVNRRIATLFLQRAGYHVEEAANGPQAWEMLQKRTYELVLLDISMPGMSGIELCRLIRSQQPASGPAVVAYTAHAMAISSVELTSAGFDGLVTKPISKASLLDTVNQCIDARH